MATYDFKLPDIGEGVMEGEIVKWLVTEGQVVAEDQPLVEVMTDKATVAIPSPKAGRVVKRYGKEGEIAKVHQPLVTLELDSAGAAASAPIRQEGANRAEEARAAAPKAPVSGNGGERVLATPVTRRMAREHGINLAELSGTGPQGRVTKQDVIAAIGGGTGAVATQPVQAPTRSPVPVAPVSLQEGREDRRIALKGLRRRVAEKMVRSKTSAPHFTFVEELDASELVRTRNGLNAALAQSGGESKISFLPFICKGLVSALRRYPTLNANFDEAKQELVVRGSYNFGIAVATDEGLTVPVVKNVDRLSIQQLASEIARLGAAAREKRLKLDELNGGTFTITSLGQNGGLLATPIINHPEVAILGVHRMRKRPVVKDDQIVVREMMYLSLSFDHRVIDGAVGADFTYALIRLLEQPELLF
ncbi:MAG TPA: dihydrolipoamide acetyltransferase family protein, partial [Myxococcaceae bacterium]|nr:dihydrolipoamide acetyltransferase family protein [Myxococcaceae bacterium]